MENRVSYKIFFITSALLIAFNIFIWGKLPSAKSSDILSVYFLDVGQADATLVRAPNGKKILIDGGRTPSSLMSELSKFMNFGDRDIDVVLATHPDADHIGGLPEVFERYNVATFIDNGKTSDSNTYRELIEKSKEENSRYIKGERGLVIVLDKKKGVYFQVLSPTKEFDFSDNDMSIVGRLVYQDRVFLLPGDAGKRVENILAYTDGEILKSDVLKAGHHGSKTSSGLLFVEVVDPRYSIISAGKGNIYGHPHASVLENLLSVSEFVLETAKEGSIAFETNGKDLWRK